MSETGATCNDTITIIVTGFSTNNIIVWLIIVIGSVAGAASSSIIGIRVKKLRKKEHQIQTLLLKAETKPRTPSTEVTESTVGTCTESREVEDEPVIPPPLIGFRQLMKVLKVIIKSFPSLAGQFPREDDVTFLMEQVRFPFQELLPFISSLLERISGDEVRTQICALMSDLKASHKDEHLSSVLEKIDALIYHAESSNDRPLLNDLLQLLMFIKYS